MSELITMNSGDFHSCKYSNGYGIPILSFSLKFEADLQKFRETILCDLHHVTFFNSKEHGKRIFSVFVIGEKKVTKVAKRLGMDFS